MVPRRSVAQEKTKIVWKSFDRGRFVRPSLPPLPPSPVKIREWDSHYEIDFGQVRTPVRAGLEMRESRAKAAGSIFLSLSGVEQVSNEPESKLGLWQAIDRGVSDSIMGIPFTDFNLGACAGTT